MMSDRPGKMDFTEQFCRLKDKQIMGGYPHVVQSTSYNPESWKKDHTVLISKNVGVPDQPDLFYRSMSMEEAELWLGGKGYDAVIGDGHQGFAQDMSYSLKYMNGSKAASRYPVMLQFHVPGYIERAGEIGVANGAQEEGVFCFGIGWKSKNGAGTNTSALQTLWSERKNSVETARIMNSINKKLNPPLTPAVVQGNFLYQQKIINSLIFIESIQSVCVVAMPGVVLEKLMRVQKLNS
ncbi:MAG: hypothetical protein HFG34_07580 [Eubacterium sp.]|nr:hypothetical protein [Eubacterium sp.]